MRGTACLLAGVRVEGPLVTGTGNARAAGGLLQWNGGMERWSGMVE